MWNNQTDAVGYQSSQQLQPTMNHGAHEIFDVQETLKTLIGAQNHFTFWKNQIKDSKLKEVAEKQHTYLIDTYNTVVESFQTGLAPNKATYPYEMKLVHDYVYGIKQQTPLSPMESPNAVNDAFISSVLLSAVKACATHATTAALECTNPVVRRVLADSVPNFIELGYELAIYQNQNHIYQVPLLQQTDADMITQGFQPASKIGLPMN
ncbi:spore coat protein [Chryseomicrobium sp. FSL W7-1435]|uniref:spore coat protein n=1 Tax=Chryseomicrobium sp. FSL W7-1435 TaxID=2921704 RepID=UPI00315A90C4